MIVYVVVVAGTVATSIQPWPSSASRYTLYAVNTIPSMGAGGCHENTAWRDENVLTAGFSGSPVGISVVNTPSPLHAPCPWLFTAATWNQYVVSGDRASTTVVSEAASSVGVSCQEAPASLTAM